jgi:hypothetical protein
MGIFSSTPLEYLLYAGYVACFMALNIIAILISLFYRKNFQRPSPRWGFLASLVLCILFLAVLLTARNGSLLLMTTARIALGGALITSMFSGLSLFFLMRRVRK